MAINFASPVNIDLAIGVLAQLRENMSSILTQTMGSGTNVPTGTFRLNPTSGVPEYWNGSAWSKIGFSTAASGGSANAQTISVGAGITAYQDGQWFRFPIGFTNTASTTLNVNSIGAVTLYDCKTGLALIGDELLAGAVAEVVYYNSKFYLMNGRAGFATWSPTIVGFSANPTNTSYTYSIDGRWCTATVRQITPGTSNSGTFTISAPYTAMTLNNGAWTTRVPGCQDNGVYSYTAIAYILQNTNSIVVNKDDSGTAFTASGAKHANFTLMYPIA